jgi:thiamine biosynthesis lipoprotein
MGTFANVTVPDSEAERIEEYAEAASNACREVEERLSLFRPDSDVSRINQAAGTGLVAVSSHTVAVLTTARHYAEASGGAFDPTVAPVVRMWGFNKGRAPERRPDADTISNTLGRVGYQHLVISNDTAGLARPGMSVDLGGIAKGYTVDLCYDRLVSLGATNFMVNLGGNIRVRGSPWRGQPWSIGVRNPFNTEEIVGAMVLSNGMAVATSGNYERFVTIGGKKYAHIMDPRTGYPLEGLAGVTVVATNGLASDGLSTSLFVLEETASMAMREKVGSWEAVFVPNRQPARLVMTPGFRRLFTPEPEWADRMETIGEKK